MRGVLYSDSFIHVMDVNGDKWGGSCIPRPHPHPRNSPFSRPALAPKIPPFSRPALAPKSLSPPPSKDGRRQINERRSRRLKKSGARIVWGCCRLVEGLSCVSGGGNRSLVMVAYERNGHSEGSQGTMICRSIASGGNDIRQRLNDLSGREWSSPGSMRPKTRNGNRSEAVVASMGVTRTQVASRLFASFPVARGERGGNPMVFVKRKGGDGCEDWFD
ncbi:unnamed protein product [Lactuca saligna]|uniref:Uncharacterized protein n=1 Tax=Lactuca saligna TaxID=75948 RepID=A0AA36EFG4_LACSI|nr:unnamed protein product [Lactuca saligna]